MTNIVAVIDIGSNTILLTAARLDSNKNLQVLADEGDVVRLSEGLKDGGPLQKEAKERTLEALARFKALSDSLDVKKIFAAGTAAFRRAADGRAFAEEIGRKFQIPVRILTGEEEAYYSYQSAAFDFQKEYGSVGMIDIGGGSTEIVFGEEVPDYSLPVGTVRLTEQFITTHPISDKEWNAARSEIQKILKEGVPNIPKSPAVWVAVAATPASLAAVFLKLPTYQPDKIHGFVFLRKDLEALVEILRLTSLSDRIAMPGMHPKRAELLPIGGLILVEIMKSLRLEKMTISDHGLRYGILLEELFKEPS